VRRRFNDFLWIREKLIQCYPSNLIPVSGIALLNDVRVFYLSILQPLPEKHSLIGQLDRYSKEFILHRMAMLHRFMNRVADHPVLSFDANFKAFISAKASVRHRI